MSFSTLLKSNSMRVVMLAASLALLAAAQASPQDANPSLANGVSTKRGASGNGHEAALLKAGWYYSWYIDPGKDVSAEFVPMIAHGKDANSWYYDRIMALKAQGKVKCLLGFNEPERKPPGGDISVDGAINAWPLFVKTGLRLGSPAPAFDDAGRKWLDAFMTKASAKNLRVDFIAVHWYGDVADPQAPAKFATWLNGIHRQYNKPIWITEFAGLNWDYLHHDVTMEMNEKFIAVLEPQMEKTKWIERYCWFSSKPGNLFDDDERTRLSRLGEIYRDGSR